jgi:1-acyl-sn-glycerol-3-phosphate acyltransferase
VDEARVIPLSTAALAGPARRARRLARRPLPKPVGEDADILAMPTQTAPAEALPEAAPEGQRWEEQLESALEFVGRRLQGGYGIDEYGFDTDLTEHVVLPLFLPLYQKWFRVEVNGIENVPDSGAALLVANHAGGLWPIDAAMTAVAVRLEHPAGRHLRPLGADLLFNTPGIGTLARRAGATLACPADTDRLLRDGELVGVWPEGFKGIGKNYRDRYKLQRFGRGGFVRSAITAQAPIVPVSIVGSEEIHPVLANASVLARLFGLPYFPITPTFPWLGPLGLVPLPSKWYLEVGEPIDTSELDAADPVEVFETTDLVRETIQATLDRLLAQRHSVWR